MGDNVGSPVERILASLKRCLAEVDSNESRTRKGPNLSGFHVPELPGQLQVRPTKTQGLERWMRGVGGGFEWVFTPEPVFSPHGLTPKRS